MKAFKYNKWLLRFYDKKLDSEFSDFYYGKFRTLLFANLLSIIAFGVFIVDDVKIEPLYMWTRISIRIASIFLIILCTILVNLEFIHKRICITNMILFFNVLLIAGSFSLLEAIVWIGPPERSRNFVLPLSYVHILVGTELVLQTF
jgi:hypothetical protein